MKRSRGFTLIEMAIVLVIITILIGGLAMPLSAQIQARRIAETNRTLEEAREALIGYAMNHATTTTCVCRYAGNGLFSSTDCPAIASCPTSISPPPGFATDATLTIAARHYFPCPDELDDGNSATTNDGDGKEAPRVGGACPISNGYLPWVTLGAAAQDGWGNRLRYAVTDAFSNMAGFSSANTGDLQVCNSSANAGAGDCGAHGNVASDVPVVILSFGPNGWGALNVNGNQLAAPSSANEQENANTSTLDNEFVSRTPSKAGDAAGEFDDLVRWISADQLRGRICPAGGCP
ncbi:type II secretion system protein [Thiobacillus sp.]